MSQTGRPTYLRAAAEPEVQSPGLVVTEHTRRLIATRERPAATKTQHGQKWLRFFFKLLIDKNLYSQNKRNLLASCRAALWGLL